jgi:hypothetical protein
VDEDGDGLVDCADPDCAADPICSSGNETLCDNLKDEDDDFLIDCEDPTDCQALAVCQPGAGPVGSACLSHNACSANNNDPLCLSEQVFGFMGGYCSEFCDLALNDCAPGAFCMPTHFSSGGVCVDICAVDADCRPGHRCMGIGSGSPFPFCWAVIEECANGVDDDDDTLVDCMDQNCQDDPACPEVCNNGIDDNENGLIDCEDWGCDADPGCSENDEAQCSNGYDDDGDTLVDCEDATDCKALAICQPGAGPAGSPCLSASACSANNNDPLCLTEANYGLLGGYCSEFCGPALNDCAPGSLCLSYFFPSGAGFCVDTCAVDADCRPGYACQDMGHGSPFCWGASEDCANGVDDDGDALVDCMDEDCEYDVACQPPEVCNNGIDDNDNGLIDCEDSACAADPTCPLSTVCAGAIPLSNGVPYSGDTTTGTSIFASYCAGSGGLEKVFSFTPGMAGQTGMLVVALSSATDHGLYMRTACEDSSSELTCDGGTDFGFGFSVDGGVPYWIFVDGGFDPAGAGPFTVTATFTSQVCGNGILENVEECDPPDGVTCDANCDFAGPPETNCSDLLDDNYDGLTDCEDPTCKALPTCTPGATPVGGVCSASSDCQANNTDPVCIDQLQFGWPQGYCTEFCDLSTNDCPASSTCAPMLDGSGGTGLCMASCAVDADCRSGYTCADIGGSKVCLDLS